MSKENEPSLTLDACNPVAPLIGCAKRIIIGHAIIEEAARGMADSATMPRLVATREVPNAG